MDTIRTRELVRPHLEEELSQLWSKPLTIITAPSGYGKTTLLRGYLKKQKEQRDIKVVWLPWGQDLVDEVWVWSRLCLKCREINEELGEKLSMMEFPETPQDIDYVGGLVRSCVKEPVCLVIDDFQECNSRKINRMLTRLAYSEIPNFHMVIISQIYPDLPYEEMVLKGYCVTLNQNMMSLNREETAEVFRINGVKMTGEALSRIFNYTDGWIAAVYLALYAYGRNGQVGVFTSASHLMKTAIFDKLSSGLQNLYMKMSLFESFTPEEAVWIAEAEILPVALTDAVETYGFMQYDMSSGKFQMHTLLKTVASGELERKRIDKKYLYNRGGEWSERSGEQIQAVIRYRNAGNYEAILRLLSGEDRYEVVESMPGLMNEIFMDAPMQLKVHYPAAWLTYIYSAVMRGDVNWSAKIYQEACDIWEQMEEDKEKLRGLKGELAVIGSLLEFNDLEKINPLLREAYELLGNQPSGIFRRVLLTHGAPIMTALYYNKVGSLKRTIELEKEYARYHMRLVGTGNGGWDRLFEAEYALLTGDMELADQLAQKVEKKSILLKSPCVQISSCYIQFRCMLYQGQRQRLEEKMQEFKEFISTLLRQTLVVDAGLVYSYIYAALGEKEKVADWIRDFNLEGCNRVVRNARNGCMAFGMLLCRTEQWFSLDSIAEQILVPYERTNHIYSVIRGYIYKAIASSHLEGMDKARENLRKAFSMAEPDQVRLPFIENSVELVPIMEGMGLKGEFVNSLKEPMRHYIKGLHAFSQEKEKVTLTPRETELMDLIKAGYRNADISRTLNIALVTVEKSLTAIYRKLGVANRAAAVNRWQELTVVER